MDLTKVPVLREVGFELPRTGYSVSFTIPFRLEASCLRASAERSFPLSL